MSTTRECRFCGRTIVRGAGRWVDPMATGDDEVWRETCDENHTSRRADHKPRVTSTVTGQLVKVARRDHSRNGNPRWDLTIDQGTTTQPILRTYTTGIDCAVGYEASNYRVGRVVVLTIEGTRDKVTAMTYENGERA